ncbi:hypothetical protein HMPREF1573_00332 [Gardnerella vaginalis JCP7276]|nr:hypothetical protein HMPREF1573_00332 [Gardnerella vaginalis JCP7276]
MCLLRVKGKLTISGVILKLKLKFTPITASSQQSNIAWVWY